VAVKASLKVAWRSETDCEDNQLEETLLTDFLLGRSQVFIQDEYLGPSWTALLRRDVTRFVANEELSDFDPASLFKISSTFSSVVTESPASSSSSATLPKMAFFDAARLHMYPAVQEVVKALHSLPAEINSMRDSSYNSYNFKNNYICFDHFSCSVQNSQTRTITGFVIYNSTDICKPKSTNQ
jgi:hypothetical protein